VGLLVICLVDWARRSRASLYASIRTRSPICTCSSHDNSHDNSHMEMTNGIAGDHAVLTTRIDS